MDFVDINQVLIYPVALAELAVLIRLWLLRLLRKYVWFAGYLAAAFLQGVLFSVLRLGPADARYAKVWIATISVIWVLQILAAWELYRRVCEHYRNFRVLGKRLLAIAALAGMLLCALTVRLDLNHIHWKWPAYWGMVLTARCLAFSLVAFLVTAALFFVRFHVPIRQNVLVHGWLIALFFAVKAASDLAYILRWNPRIAATVFMVAQLLLLLGWIVLLSKRGEIVDVWPEATEEEYAAEQARTARLIDIARKL
ncbi:MAG: hypothetical protein ABSH47_22725 [Bryobacteraceae bacterium]